ncbi:hypothetical protein FB565_000324 [Actinoplanes lutulentus]|uniref:Uncharacterized protein n=1 Tax=Actinoplanes lutulentus TaxID=1287878 RepID=A0A327ZKZ3_9ACTN|nr:hypothetical protein [Actinoplanes lutulentus]RAK42931.1 hypothetical protein B0I29_10161 [Actinoplanes lutulentus]
MRQPARTPMIAAVNEASVFLGLLAALGHDGEEMTA